MEGCVNRLRFSLSRFDSALVAQIWGNIGQYAVCAVPLFGPILRQGHEHFEVHSHKRENAGIGAASSRESLYRARGCFKSFITVMHLKRLIQILMMVLAVGLNGPVPVCASPIYGEDKAACCCQPDGTCTQGMPCKSSCEAAQIQIFEKQSPTPAAQVPSVQLTVQPCTFAPATNNFSASVAALHRGDVNASPPFGGSPPQAILRLWLI